VEEGLLIRGIINSFFFLYKLFSLGWVLQGGILFGASFPGLGGKGLPGEG